jgi:hypothetical protein
MPDFPASVDMIKGPIADAISLLKWYADQVDDAVELVRDNALEWAKEVEDAVIGEIMAGVSTEEDAVAQVVRDAGDSAAETPDAPGPGPEDAPD